VKAWLLALLVGPVMAQAPSLPVCWPLLSNADYSGSWLSLGEGQQCRWMQWVCIPTDITKSSKVVTFAGLKSSNPTTTMLGRMLTVENTSDINKPTIYTLMWKTYVTGPIDPICVAEIGP
jgi:hypothetical protein